MDTGCPYDIQSVTSSAIVCIPTHAFTLTGIYIYSYFCQGDPILTISPALIQYF